MPLRSRRQTPCSAAPSAGTGDSDGNAPLLTRSRLLCVAACVSVLITGCIYTFSNGSHTGRRSKRSNIAPSTHSFHVVCYGDSLTAGTSPPLRQKQPYAPHLQQQLNDIQKSAQVSSRERMPPVVVTWRGMPGWTAEKMLQSANDTRTGIVPFVQFSPRTPDVAVLLAGTNDLGRKRPTGDILNDIFAMHKLCFKMGIKRTVAVGIPPSAWQASTAEVASTASELNAGIDTFCNSTQRDLSKGEGFIEAVSKSGVAKFVHFPFPFDKGGERWANDGLHLTPKGYKELGQFLAEPVEEVLSELRHTRSAKKKQKQGQRGWFRKGSK